MPLTYTAFFHSSITISSAVRANTLRRFRSLSLSPVQCPFTFPATFAAPRRVFTSFAPGRSISRTIWPHASFASAGLYSNDERSPTIRPSFRSLSTCRHIFSSASTSSSSCSAVASSCRRNVNEFSRDSIDPPNGVAFGRCRGCVYTGAGFRTISFMRGMVNFVGDGGGSAGGPIEEAPFTVSKDAASWES